MVVLVTPPVNAPTSPITPLAMLCTPPTTDAANDDPGSPRAPPGVPVWTFMPGIEEGTEAVAARPKEGS